MVEVRSSTAVLIKGFTVRPSLDPSLNGTEAGIYVWYDCNNCNVSDCVIADFNNTLIDRTLYGMRISGYQCAAYGNVIEDNYYGILLDGIQSTISENVIRDSLFGIYSMTYEGDGGHIIFRNNVTNNDYGMYCYQYYGTGSNIAMAFENIIKENDYGVYLDTSINNRFVHNNFENNGLHAYSYGSANATWDNGCEGNYWNNYVGTDIDGDGVGDTPYVIDAGNRDNCPLMNRTWNPSDINHDLYVNMKDIGISARAFGSSAGQPNWNPHADITGSVYLVPDNKVNMRDIGLIARDFGKTYT